MVPEPGSVPASHLLLLAVPFMIFSYKTTNIDSPQSNTGRREHVGEVQLPAVPTCQSKPPVTLAELMHVDNELHSQLVRIYQISSGQISAAAEAGLSCDTVVSWVMEDERAMLSADGIISYAYIHY